MRALSSKRGQVGNLAPAMLSLIFAAVVLIFGIIMTQSLKDNPTLKSQFTTTNETNAWINQTTYQLTAEDGLKTNNFAIVSIVNATGGDGNVLTAANYTLNTATGTLVNASVTTWSNVNITYTYYSGGDAWDAANNTTAGLGTFGSYWEIIVLAIIISVVIGLLLSVFGGRRAR